MNTTLGIDLGTSELKLALVDEPGALVASAGAPLTRVAPAPALGRAASARLVARAAGRARARCASATRRVGGVRAIGLSGQMHGAVLLDARRPRAAPRDPVERHAQRRAVRRARAPPALAAAASRATSRCPASPRPSCCGWPSTSREIFARVGQRAAAQGLAALAAHGRRGQRHVRRRRHAVAGRRPPRLVGRAAAGERHDARADAGAGRGLRRLRAPARPTPALALGLPEGLPVAGGGGDNAASAVGIGAMQAGEGFLSLGTSGAAGWLHP